MYPQLKQPIRAINCKGKGIRFIVLYPPKCSHDLPPLAGTVHTDTISIPRGIFQSNCVKWYNLRVNISPASYLVSLLDAHLSAAIPFLDLCVTLGQGLIPVELNTEMVHFTNNRGRWSLGSCKQRNNDTKQKYNNSSMQHNPFPVASEFGKKWQLGKQNKTLTYPARQVMFRQSPCNATQYCF